MIRRSMIRSLECLSRLSVQVKTILHPPVLALPDYIAKPLLMVHCAQEFPPQSVSLLMGFKPPIQGGKA